jgi:hypothetical protein
VHKYIKTRNPCAKEVISEQWASTEGPEMAEKVPAEDSCTYVQQVMDVLNRVEQDQKELDEGKHEEEKKNF